MDVHNGIILRIPWNKYILRNINDESYNENHELNKVNKARQEAGII